MRARAGFTLLEVLVAITVAGLVLAAGFAALGFVRDRSLQLEAASRATLAGATQRALIVDWLGGARASGNSQQRFTGEDATTTGDIADTILFPTTSPTPIEGPASVVGLYIDVDPNTPEVGLVAELTGAVVGPAPRRMELVPAAGGMEIRYLPDVDGETEWVDGWQERGGLPRGVELTLFPARGDTLPALLRYPIRVALATLR